MLELQSVWGWQPALYLFLGGLGAGAFVAASALLFRNYEAQRKTAGVVYLASVVCLAVGLLLLLSELTNPLRGLMMWQSFSSFSSWMAIGAWLLFAAIIVMVLAALVTFEPLAKLTGKIGFVQSRGKTITLVLAGIGSVLSLGVAVYTGVLLMVAPGVPLWNTALLPCIFTASALDTGVALVELVSMLTQKDPQEAHRSRRALEIAVVVLVVLEGLAVVAFCQTMLAGGSATAVTTDSAVETAQASIAILLSGQLSSVFWGWFVFVGLVIPLLAALLGLVASEHVGKVALPIGAVCALVGGCVLRFIILMAGLHANILVDAVSSIVFF